MGRSLVSAAEFEPVAELFDANFGFALRSLRHLGVSEHALDDAVQDVFVVAHRRWSTFEGRSSSRTWLFGIARRIASHYRRRDATRRERSALGDVVPDPAHRPFDRAVAAHSLASMLGRLDEGKRSVFVLHELEGMTAPEVADALGIPLGTAYSRLRAAWKVLGKEAELEQLRAREDPKRQRRVWGLLVAKLATAPVGPAPWFTQLKALGAGAAIGAALLAVAVSAPSTDDAAPAPRPAAAVERPEAAAPKTVALPVAPAVASPTPPADVEIAVRPAPLKPARTTAPRAPEHVHEPRPVPDTLAAELELVRSAQQALGDRKPKVALHLLEQHARRYPQGQLRKERAAARISAFCMAGQAAEALASARALGRSGDPCS